MGEGTEKPLRRTDDPRRESIHNNNNNNNNNRIRMMIINTAEQILVKKDSGMNRLCKPLGAWMAWMEVSCL